jgi:6-phosphofructokinase
VSSEIKRPPKQTESKDASLYASSQAGLFNPEVSCEAVVTSAVIDSIKTFRVPNVRDWLGELPKYENKFFRTRSGSEGKLGYSHRVDHHQSLSPNFLFLILILVILMDLVRKTNKSDSECLSFARAGPRDYTVFHPSQIKAAIVTCGGLCPGLNDVIYELTQMLYCTLCSHFVVSEGDVDNYGVDDIFGIRNGYRGFYDPAYHPYLTLDPDSTKDIHKKGGTMLGSSRGGFDKVKIIDACIKMGINQVYVIGGDGTHRGASELAKEARERNLLFTVVGIPKTIDNDIALIDRSFGFDTAVEEAVKAIDSVRIESECVPNGIGIVKLMGRHAGFIAAHATLANRNVDLCLIPEVPVELEGERGILSHIERTLESVGRCVIVLAEGAVSNHDPSLILDVTREEIS